MGAARVRRFAAIASGIIAVVSLAGFGGWFFIQRPDTRSAEKLCERLGTVDSLSASFISLDPTTLGPQVAELQRAAAVAPSDIQAQITALTAFVQEIAEAVRASPTNKKAALTAALAEKQNQVDEVSQAGQAVEAWSLTNCGTPLRATTTTSTKK
ncbi:MAG: hypothetical protein WEA11_05860 [Acidimicrobiales bacterium]